MVTILFLLFVIFLLYSNNEGGNLSLEKSNILKALFPYLIILHHVSQTTGDFLDFRWAGPYGVGVFFFISGYGIEYKRSKGQLGIRSFFIRMKSVILPILLPAIIYLLLLSRDGVDVGDYFIQKLMGYSIVFPYTWFVLTLTILYISYYLLSSCLEGRWLYVAEFAFLLAFSTTMIKLKMDGTTYITTYCFLAGAMYNYLEKCICRFQTRMFVVSLVFVLFLTTTFLALSEPPFKGYALFGSLVWTVSFIFLYTKTKVQYHMVFNHLKNISYDVFLCQGIAFYILKKENLVEENFIYAFLSITISVVLGELCYKIRKIMNVK